MRSGGAQKAKRYPVNPTWRRFVLNTIGIPGLLIILGIVLVIFGPKRLPDLGRSLGSGLREFKDSIARKASSDDEDRERIDAMSTPAAGAASEPRSGATTTSVVDGEPAGDRQT